MSVDGRGNLTYRNLIQKVLFSSEGQSLHLAVRRPGHDGPFELNIEPRREAHSDRPTMGILQSESLEIGGFLSPPGMVNPPSYPSVPERARTKKVDVLVSAGPSGQEPVRLTDSFAYDRLLQKYADKPITHHIECRPILANGDEGAPIEKFELTLPPNQFRRSRAPFHDRPALCHPWRFAGGAGRISQG